MENQDQKKTNYFDFSEVFRYFLRLFGKKDPSRPTNFNIRAMHMINRIAILMFLIGLTIMIVRAITRA